MICPKCGEILVVSNIYFEDVPDDLFYGRYFCFGCDTLFECKSQSGDFVEDLMEELGEVEYEF